MWQRGILLPLLLLSLTVTLAAQPVSAQPDCASPGTLATGNWTGAFEIEWEAHWTAGLSVQGLPSAPATWERNLTLHGEIDLAVRETEMLDTPAVAGTARALWREETRAEREDGAWMSRFNRGWLTGGTLIVPADRALTAGDTIEWLGAWWTAPVPEEGDALPISASGMDHVPGRGTLFIDGVTSTQPAEPLRFQVTGVTCAEITGTVDPAAFRYPQLGREAGPDTVNGSAGFTLRRSQG